MSAAVTVWQAILIVGGGLVAGALALSAIAKLPGGRWLFQRLVADPVRDTVKGIITVELGEHVERSVESHLDAKLEPICVTVRQINDAVNNVGPNTPRLRDRVANLESGQEHIKGQLEVVTTMLDSLVRHHK